MNSGLAHRHGLGTGPRQHGIRAAHLCIGAGAAVQVVGVEKESLRHTVLVRMAPAQHHSCGPHCSRRRPVRSLPEAGAGSASPYPPLVTTSYVKPDVDRLPCKTSRRFRQFRGPLVFRLLGPAPMDPRSRAHRPRSTPHSRIAAAGIVPPMSSNASKRWSVTAVACDHTEAPRPVGAGPPGGRPPVSSVPCSQHVFVLLLRATAHRSGGSSMRGWCGRGAELPCDMTLCGRRRLRRRVVWAPPPATPDASGIRNVTSWTVCVV